MAVRTVVVDIEADGTVRVDMEGFEGDACVETAQKLLAELPEAERTVERKRPKAATRTTAARVSCGLGRKP